MSFARAPGKLKVSVGRGRDAHLTAKLAKSGGEKELSEAYENDPKTLCGKYWDAELGDVDVTCRNCIAKLRKLR